jgi:hypothetical protein
MFAVVLEAVIRMYIVSAPILPAACCDGQPASFSGRLSIAQGKKTDSEEFEGRPSGRIKIGMTSFAINQKDMVTLLSNYRMMLMLEAKDVHELRRERESVRTQKVQRGEIHLGRSFGHSRSHGYLYSIDGIHSHVIFGEFRAASNL